MRRTACTIEETVACFDSVIDLFSAGIVVDLPEAKADDGHLLAIVEFDDGRRHIGWLQVNVRECQIVVTI